MSCNLFTQSSTRRGMLLASACGFGHVALSALAGQGMAVEQDQRLNPLAPRMPHLPQRAKRIIFLFMWGGPSHVDLFDPKPRLNVDDGKPLEPTSVGSDKTESLGDVLGSPFRFAQYGEGGMWISELFPHLSRHADRLCMMRSIHTEGRAHGEALLRLHTGQANLVRPSVGAWVSYGLGGESENLPAFITISPPRGHGGVQNYGSAFLPAIHQGTAIGSAEIPISQATISNVVNKRLSSTVQRNQLDLIQEFNQRHLQESGADPGIEGLINSYELAFRMQSAIPQAMNLDNESQGTLDLYGVGDKTQRTTLAASVCWLASLLRPVCATFRFLPTISGTTIRRLKLDSYRSPRRLTARLPVCLKTLLSAGCWKTRSCCGAPNSAEHRWQKMVTAGGIIPRSSRCGWLAVVCGAA